MYSYIKGTITEIKAASITVENHHIGYKLITPNPFKFQKNEEMTVYLYQRVMDDKIILYGFKSRREKELFIKLISVSGIGPKSANAILASGSVDAISRAIENGEHKYLQQFPGIGPKASQQIVLDLKGKIDIDSSKETSDSLAEVDEALSALGYNKREIRRAMKHLDSDEKTDVLVKQALKNMLK